MDADNLKSLNGRVALVTGAARGMGRSQALRLAERGADIIAVDVPQRVDSSAYALAQSADLAETASAVKALGREVVVGEVDVRDREGLREVAQAGYERFGRLDVVVANAGIWSSGLFMDITDETLRETIDVNLMGTWNTCRAGAEFMIKADQGGSIVLISSTVGLRAGPGMSHYSAAKHGVVGVMRSVAHELARHRIRVNSVHPGPTSTHMIHNPVSYGRLLPSDEELSTEDVRTAFTATNLLPVPWVEPIDIANAVLFLASDDARYITGATLPVDAGRLLM